VRIAEGKGTKGFCKRALLIRRVTKAWKGHGTRNFVHLPISVRLRWLAVERQKDGEAD